MRAIDLSPLRGLGRSLDPTSERELAATLLGGIALAGSLVGFSTFVLPHPEGTDFVLPSFAFAGSIVAGIVLLRRRRTVGWLPIAIFVALGSLVVTTAMISVPGRTASYATYYVWLGIFSFYFLRPRWAVAQIAWIAVLYAVAVAIDSPPGPVEIWLNGVATTLGVGLLVFALRKRIAGLMGRLETVAATDQLTGLPNRRSFDEQFGRELARSRRSGTSASLLLLDLDRFKELNDTAGHVAGDTALREVAEVIGMEVRPADWPARIGGDEFAVILPEVDEDGARRVAARLCSRISVRFGTRPVQLRASAGVAGFASGPADGDQVMRSADRALYMAKRVGGGRAIAAGSLDEAPTAPPPNPDGVVRPFTRR